MEILEHYDKVDRWKTTTYYPKFQSSVSRITVTDESIYVDRVLPTEESPSRIHELSEFESLLNSIYEQETENQTYRKEEI